MRVSRSPCQTISMPSFNEVYAGQLALLLEVLPHVAAEENFALKGGTAINLFFRDLPRLSVDIDLVWLPLDNRDQALAGIKSALDRIALAVRTDLRCRVKPKLTHEGVPVGLLIERQRVAIKIEVTPVLRGSVFNPEMRTLQPNAMERFGFLQAKTLGFADLYAGKLVAAIDRQHPRDLFDIKHLFANEGLTDELWSAFLVYMLAASRPSAEMIEPNRLSLQESFVNEFAGMTEEPVDVGALEAARETLLGALHSRIDCNVREFLLSFEREMPEWQRLRLPTHVCELPAIRWKLLNLGKRSAAKREADYRQLAKTLERIPMKGTSSIRT